MTLFPMSDVMQLKNVVLLSCYIISKFWRGIFLLQPLCSQSLLLFEGYSCFGSYAATYQFLEGIVGDFTEELWIHAVTK